MRFLKLLVTIMMAAAVTGCAITYSLEGKQYKSKEEFLAAADSSAAESVAAIVPLPAPVSKRGLVFSIPSLETMDRANRAYHQQRTGSAPNAMAIEMMDNVGRANHKLMQVYFDAIVRRNIYSKTTLVLADTATPSFSASEDRDVLFWYEGAVGSGGWFYVTVKNGKQVFAVDRTDPTPAGKTRAFVEAVQLQAIKD